jgi:hypothetical protein
LAFSNSSRNSWVRISPPPPSQASIFVILWRDERNTRLCGASRLLKVEEQKRHTSMAEIDALRCSQTCAECGGEILVNTHCEEDTSKTTAECW